MKKTVCSVLILILICLLCAAAGAAPSVTDGETTGWIAEKNYLFLQSPNGTVAQLSMEISDLIGIMGDELICLGGNDQVIAVKTNVSVAEYYAFNSAYGMVNSAFIALVKDSGDKFS